MRYIWSKMGLVRVNARYARYRRDQSSLSTELPMQYQTSAP